MVDEINSEAADEDVWVYCASMESRLRRPSTCRFYRSYIAMSYNQAAALDFYSKCSSLGTDRVGQFTPAIRAAA